MAIALSGRLDFDPVTDTITAPDGTEVRLDAPIGEVLPSAGYDPGEDTFTPPRLIAVRYWSRSHPRVIDCNSSSPSPLGMATTTKHSPC